MYVTQQDQFGPKKESPEASSNEHTIALRAFSDETE
jgi:hypothetical protein